VKPSPGPERADRLRRGERGEAAKASKKAYHTPELTVYGPVSRLTRSGGSVNLPDAGQTMRMPCL
jgi:hypothetical protein